MSNQRKRKALSVEEKVAIIKKYDEESPTRQQKDIASDLGITGSTLRTILANREKTLAVVGGSKRLHLKAGHYEDLERVLLEWFRQARASNLPLSGPLLKEKATEIAGRLGIDDFAASAGWLDRFRKRHGIVYRQISGEAEAVSNAEVTSWAKNTLPLILKDYAMDDVYNADKFGLFYKMLPDKSFVFKDESCHGGKLSKERLTVLACTNATGSDKRKLLVIGKSRSPRCFKNIHSLPVNYQAQQRAWMTSDFYISWLKDFDCHFIAKKKEHSAIR